MRWLVNTITYVGHALLDERPAGRREKLAAFLMFAVLAAALSHFEVATMWLHNLDTAFLVESMRAVNATGEPLTRLGPAFLDAYTTFALQPEAVCRAPLEPTGRALSILTSHAYYLVYPLAWIARVVPAAAVLGIAIGVAFTGFIYALYLLLRRQGVPVIAAVLFCVLATGHPAWAFGPLGDVYLDRLFIPLGLVYAAQLHRLVTGATPVTPPALAILFAVAALAVSGTERNAIMIGYMTAVFVGLYWKTTPARLRLMLAVFCLLLVLYVLAWIATVYVPHQATPAQSEFIRKTFRTLALLATPTYRAQVLELLTVNLLVFGIFLLADWRLAVIAVMALMPNFLVTMGGAEKNGWVTHYHSLYLPFVLFAAGMGLARLWRRLEALRLRVALLAGIALLHPLLTNASPSYRTQPSVLQRVYLFYRLGPESSEMYRVGQLEQLLSVVPSGAKVTTIEGFMPAFEEGRTIFYYPIGIEVADYAVLPSVKRADGSYSFSGAISYLGLASQAEPCLNERLRRAGFDVDRPLKVVGSHAVLARTKR